MLNIKKRKIIKKEKKNKIKYKFLVKVAIVKKF